MDESNFLAQWEAENARIFADTLERLGTMIGNKVLEQAIGTSGPDTLAAALDAYRALHWILEPYKRQVVTYSKREYPGKQGQHSP